MDFDNVGTGTETVASTENSSESETEDSEENGLIHIEPDHQDPSDFWDEEEDSSDFIGPWYENSALFSPAVKNVFFDEDYNGVELETRAYWGPNDTFQTVKASGIGNVTIGPAFSSWEWPVGTDKWLKVEAIFLAAQNSINATNARIDKTNTEVGNRALKTTVDNAFTRIAKNESWIASHNTWAGGQQNRIDTLYSWKTGADNFFADQRTNNTYQQGVLNSHQAWIDSHNTWAGGQKERIDTLYSWKTGADNFFADQRTNNTYQQGVLNSHQAWIDSHNTWAGGQKERIDTLYSWKTGADNFFEDQRTNNKYQQDILNNHQSLIDNLSSWKAGADNFFNDQRTNNTYQQGVLNSHQKSIDDLGTWKNVQLAWNGVQELGMADLQNQIDNLSFENGNFDDTGIINQLKEIEKAWYSNDYWTPTLLADDGGMVKLIKSQFQRLYELVFSLLNAFRDGGIFWLAWEANLPKLGELITECLDTSTPGTPLYAMRYSMTEGFMELQEAVEYATGKIRDNQVTEMTNQETMISALEEIRDHTAIVTQWLKLIYEKPTGSFIESPFDFDRLEEILGNLNFGNIVNEAGTNIWDFLSELISELGDVLGKGIDGVASVLGDILDFLDGFLDKIIHLIVPENTSFLDTNFATIKGKFQAKFGSILDLGGKVKDVFVPAKVDFFESTTFEIMGAKFRADKATADLFIPKFRVVMALFIWFEVAWFVYRKITGGGDMINDN